MRIKKKDTHSTSNQNATDQEKLAEIIAELN